MEKENADIHQTAPSGNGMLATERSGSLDDSASWSVKCVVWKPAASV